MKLNLANRTSRALQVRLFLTCWLIFVLHFATNFVREHYLVLSIVDDASFRLDEYVDLHVDIFETPDHGAHHGANPGASIEFSSRSPRVSIFSRNVSFLRSCARSFFDGPN